MHYESSQDTSVFCGGRYLHPSTLSAFQSFSRSSLLYYPTSGRPPHPRLIVSRLFLVDPGSPLYTFPRPLRLVPFLSLPLVGLPDLVSQSPFVPLPSFPVPNVGIGPTDVNRGLVSPYSTKNHLVPHQFRREVDLVHSSPIGFRQWTGGMVPCVVSCSD